MMKSIDSKETSIKNDLSTTITIQTHTHTHTHTTFVHISTTSHTYPTYDIALPVGTMGAIALR